jgi:hypothetical protein
VRGGHSRYLPNAFPRCRPAFGVRGPRVAARVAAS